MVFPQSRYIMVSLWQKSGLVGGERKTVNTWVSLSNSHSECWDWLYGRTGGMGHGLSTHAADSPGCLMKSTNFPSCRGKNWKKQLTAHCENWFWLPWYLVSAALAWARVCFAHIKPPAVRLGLARFNGNCLYAPDCMSIAAWRLKLKLSTSDCQAWYAAFWLDFVCQNTQGLQKKL